MNPLRLERLLEQTRDPNPKVRKAALVQLCPCRVRSNPAALWDRLIAMGSDPDPGVRSMVLHNLCDGSPRGREAEVVAAVERLAKDGDRKLRRRARKALELYRSTGRINTEGLKPTGGVKRLRQLARRPA